jgi:hypothetical protein
MSSKAYVQFYEAIVELKLAKEWDNYEALGFGNLQIGSIISSFFLL